jgi:ubiquinone biosynthesis protein UbiJ
VTLDLDAVNRALEGESWARDKLSRHAGRNVRLSIGPLERNFAIEASGRLVPTTSDPDLALAVSPLSLPALAAAPERWSELVRAEGDAPLAATLAELATTIPWFVERTFSSFLGPVLGQQVADAGRRLLSLPGYAGTRIGASVSRYVSDETRWAVGAAEAQGFAAEVAALAVRIDALEARIAALDSDGGS